MQLEFIVKTQKDIDRVEDFKRAVVEKISDMINDYYWLRKKDFNFEVISQVKKSD